MVAKAAKNFIVVADPHKMVPILGTFPLPIEVVPFGFEMTMKYIRDLGCSPQLRQINGVPFQTDNGNYIFDCSFSEIRHPRDLERDLNLIPGVVDNGLFIRMADTVITLNNDMEIVLHERANDR